MNNIFNHISADDKLKAETLKKAKANKVFKWKTVSVIAAALVVTVSASAFLFPRGGKNYATDFEMDSAPEGYTNTLYSSGIKEEIIFDYSDKSDDIMDSVESKPDDSRGEEAIEAPMNPDEVKPVPEATGRPEATSVPEATKMPEEAPDGTMADLSINLTAARLDDNKNFDSWLEKLKDYNTFKEYDTFGFSATKKITIKVIDNEEKPVKNASVVLLSGGEEAFKTVTDNKGVAYLYYNWYYKAKTLTPDTVKVESNGKVYEEKTDGKQEITVKGDFEKTYLNELDIMFMIDTTGSMTDELDYLKYQTSSMLQKLPVQLNTKISVNFYRDKGDEYVVKANPFTGSIPEVTACFSQTGASGGGDTPEAVDSALKNAIEEHSWRKDAVKIMFLVLDAAAHDEEQAEAQLYESISKATEMGVRIVPVMASGADEVCELMCRQMALITGGQFVFLTDDSGIGSSHREPVTDVEYDVKPLITVLKEIINEYTA